MSTELVERHHKRNELLEEIQKLKTRVAEVDRLKQENESLKADIHRLREAQKEQPPLLKNRTVLGELSPNKSTTRQHAATPRKGSPGDEALDPVAKYAKLFAESKKLKAKHQAVLENLDTHRAKLRQRNNTVAAWARYADTQEWTLQRLRAKLRSRHGTTAGVAAARAEETFGLGDAVSEDDETLDPLARKRPSPISSLAQEPPLSPPLVVNAQENLFLPTVDRQILSEPPPCLPEMTTAEEISVDPNRGGNLVTDEVELPPHQKHPSETILTVKAEPSSDGPVFVSSRSVRKRKHEKDESEDVRVRRIKIESSSSSGPELVAESQHFSPAESIDFEDEVHVPTPRKPRAPRGNGDGYQGTDAEATPGPGAARILNFEVAGSSSEVNRPRASFYGAAGSKSPSRRSLALHESLSHVSRPVSADNAGKSANTKPYLSPLTLGVMDLADDGDGAPTKLQRSVDRSRLDILLNKSPVKKELTPINRSVLRDVQAPRPIPAPRLASADARTLREAATTPVTHQKSGAALTPLPTIGRDRGLKEPKKPSILRDDMPRGRLTTREETPLRQRPLDSLRPEDFKPNPLYNEGLTFVYDEVLRGKARAALSGCTDLNCCGKTFRKFAEAQRRAAEASGSSVTTRVEDISLMENYLGDEAGCLGSMTQKEKDETWLLAKTWELANRFGKHRQRYSRMPTPPGFWNVEFPNTQERAEERKQADEIRKALVLERHREAMRGGGSWLFRDEGPR